MDRRIKVERETDGRWLASVSDLPGVMCYGLTRDEAIRKVAVLAFNAIGEKCDRQEG